MTAEVMVLNREAIAIAADSAVTLEHLERKVYNSANKLFELSSTEPIGIMVYGGASFGLIPWETVIKQYRKRLGDTRFDTIDEYASDFVSYLDHFVDYHPPEIQLGYAERVVMSELEWAVNYLQRERKRRRDFRQVFRHEDQTSYLIDGIMTQSTELETLECLDPVDKAAVEDLVDQLFADWFETVRDCFDRIRDFSISAQHAAALKSLAAAALRSVSMGGSASGVVVAGFGARQLFPAWTSYGVDGIVADKVRARHLERFEVGPLHPVDIRAFAQDDMVLTFLNGVHPSYPEALKAFVTQALDQFIDELRSVANDAELTDQLEGYMSRINGARTTVNTEFHGKLEELLLATHKQPTMLVVSMLPKEELAEFAETLVALTSFKRRMTLGLETVGGPIDVAVISKGDGLVWVKRKHYFDKKFNLRYFERNRRRDDDTSA